MRTFFVIFISMDLEILENLHEELKGRELGDGTHVLLRHSLLQTDANNGTYYTLWFLCKEPIVKEDTFQNAMIAYYNIMKDYAGDIKVCVNSIVFTGGLKDATDGINILNTTMHDWH